MKRHMFIYMYIYVGGQEKGGDSYEIIMKQLGLKMRQLFFNCLWNGLGITIRLTKQKPNLYNMKYLAQKTSNLSLNYF